MSKKTLSDTQDLPLVVGVDLGGTWIRVAVLRGTKLLSRVREPTRGRGSPTDKDSFPDRIIPRILDAIQQAIEEAGTSDRIAGIGIGVPGPVNSTTGVIFSLTNLQGWNDIPLRDKLEKEYHISTPIFIDNDANAAALGEYLFGAGRGSNFMVYLTISTGIGGSVIMNGQIMRGVSGAAMEIGHMTIHEFGEECNCGNIGCLESIASGTAIARSAQKAIDDGRGTQLLEFARSEWARESTVSNGSTSLTQDSTLNEQEEAKELKKIDALIVGKAAEAGEPVARDIIKRAAEALGVGLINIIHIFNPDRIILGGGVSQIGSMLLVPARRFVDEYAMEVPRSAVRIELAQLHADVGLIGAGALVFYEKGVENMMLAKAQED